MGIEKCDEGTRWVVPAAIDRFNGEQPNLLLDIVSGHAREFELELVYEGLCHTLNILNYRILAHSHWDYHLDAFM